MLLDVQRLLDWCLMGPVWRQEDRDPRRQWDFRVTGIFPGPLPGEPAER